MKNRSLLTDLNGLVGVGVGRVQEVAKTMQDRMRTILETLDTHAGYNARNSVSFAELGDTEATMEASKQGLVSLSASLSSKGTDWLRKNKKEGIGEEQTEGSNTVEDSIIKHLALAAQVAGVDLDDDDQLKTFMGDVRNVITKDKSKLRSQLRRWTSGKARAAVKATKASI